MKAGREQSICVFGGGVILRYVRAMQVEVAGTRQAGDLEYIHRMRVASRRLRIALPLFRKCLPAKKLEGWQKEVRAITRALGAARDTDVQLDLLRKTYTAAPLPVYRPGLRRLALRLSQRRAKMQARVTTALDALESSQALEQLEAAAAPLVAGQQEVYIYTPALYQLGFQSISSALEQFLSYDRFVSQPEEIEKLHAMRIAAKHLRYTLETFAPLYPDELKPFVSALRAAQESLGDIHDCDVWQTSLPQFLEKETRRVQRFYGSARPARRLMPGLTYFEQDRKTARDASYTQFVADWQSWQAEAIWDALRKTINRPFFRLEKVTPNPRKRLPPAEVEAAP
jgi:CHAD domain-containing protein